MAVIEIREYTQRFMADEARGLLEEAGIDCMVSGDDGGGAYPQVQFTSGYRVLIQEEDVQKAEEVLSVLGPYTPPEGMGLYRE
jgi:hypothetical protein